MALCPELERSLSLLQPGAGQAEQQQQQERRVDVAPTPMVFMCAGCRRPMGNTCTWGSVPRTAAPSCCAVSTSAAIPTSPRSLPPCLLPCLPPQLRPPASPRTRGGRALSSPESADGEGRAWLDTVLGELEVPGAGDKPGKGPGALMWPESPWSTYLGWAVQAAYGLRERDFSQGHVVMDKGGSFRFNVRKKFFPARVVRPWHRFPREAVAAPVSLEVPKARLDGAWNTLG
ncbi:uncharacterized protein LOC134550794 [Prinia subflava]|uniref:uncharacterized protein LOC134550794 n=1 Tax=Prinia subflava TaxID=208062 RepID=UPI002FDF9DC6